MATIEQLKTLADKVANATEIGENTAERVGGALQQAAELIALLLTSAGTAEGNDTKHDESINGLQTAVANLKRDLNKEATERKDEDTKNYNALNALISALQGQVNILVGNNASEAIENFNEVIAFLAGVKDDKTLTALLSNIQESIKELERKGEQSGELLQQQVNNTANRVAGIGILPFNGIYNGEGVEPTYGIWYCPNDTRGAGFRDFGGGNFGVIGEEEYNSDLVGRTDKIFRKDGNLYHIVDGKMEKLSGGDGREHVILTEGEYGDIPDDERDPKTIYMTTEDEQQQP